MPVDVPKLQRTGPAQPTSVGRVEARAPDVSSQQTLQAAGRVLDTSERIFRKFEQDAVNTAKKDAANKLEQWWTERVEGENGLKFIQGDPTQAYEQFEEELFNKMEELSDNESWSDKTRDAVKVEMSRRYNRLKNRTTVLRGAQWQRYRENAYKTTQEFNKRNVVSSAGYLDPKTGENDLIEHGLSVIGNDEVENAVAIGSATPTENLKEADWFIVNEDNERKGFKLNPSVKYSIGSQQAEAVYKTINNLLATRDIDRANYVKQKYGEYLEVDPQIKARVERQFDQVQLETKAYQALSKADRMEPEKRTKFLDSIKDERVKQEVFSLIDTRERIKRNRKIRISEQNFNEVFGIVDNMMQSNQLVSMTQAKTIPEIAGRLNSMSPEHRQAIEKMIERPDQSDLNVLGKMYEHARTGKLNQFSRQELQIEMSGLDETDMERFYSMWVKGSQEGTSSQRARANWMAQRLYEQAIASGLITEDRFQNLSAQEKRYINALQGSLYEKMDSLPDNMSQSDQFNYIKEIIADEVKKRIEPGFISGSSRDITFNFEEGIEIKEFGSAKRKRQDISSVIKWGDLSIETQREIITRFKEVKGRDPSLAEAKQFYLEGQQ